ncbi:MAG: hypothetical protein P8Z37_07065 [Acidobacteriota bacterium]
MDDERVKSALELAMEKLSGLPELTPEEVAEQKEKEFKPIGEAIGHRYMQGIVNEENLQGELNRKDSNPIVIRALFSTLCKSIQLENPAEADRALQGLLSMCKTWPGFIEDTRSLWSEIVSEFSGRLDEKYDEIEAFAVEAIESMGISGSAIRPNPKENPFFKKELKALLLSFEPKLEQLRSRISEKLQIG